MQVKSSVDMNFVANFITRVVAKEYSVQEKRALLHAWVDNFNGKQTSEALHTALLNLVVLPLLRALVDEGQQEVLDAELTDKVFKDVLAQADDQPLPYGECWLKTQCSAADDVQCLLYAYHTNKGSSTASDGLLLCCLQVALQASFAVVCIVMHYVPWLLDACKSLRRLVLLCGYSTLVCCSVSSCTAHLPCR